MRPPATSKAHQKLSLKIYLPNDPCKSAVLIRVLERLHVLDTGAGIEQHNSFAGFYLTSVDQLPQCRETSSALRRAKHSFGSTDLSRRSDQLFISDSDRGSA